MPSRLRGVLAVLPVLLAFVLVPGASATCGMIDAYVPSGKSWYSAADTPPTVLFDMADDENSQKDFFNVTTQGWLSAVRAGAFGFTTTPPWSAYAAGPNYLEAQLHCGSGLQTWGTIVRFDPWIPTVAWSAPAAGQWLRGSVALQLTGSDSLSGVASYTYSLPTGSVSSTSGATTFDTTGAPDGTQVLSGVSVDLVGNRSAAVTRVVRVDNGAPGVAIDVATSPLVASPTMTVSATASDAQSGVAQVRFEGRAGGTGAWQALGSDSEAPYRITLATPAVEGDYDVRAIATDAIGNEASSAVGTRVIDRIAPVASLNAVPAVLTGTVGLSAVATDSGSGIAQVDFQAAPTGSEEWQSLAIDDSSPYAMRIATPGLSDGSYAIRVVARDAAGNETISGLRSTIVRNAAVPTAAPGTAPTAATAPTAPTAGTAATPVAAVIAAGKQAVTLTARALPHRVEGGHAIVVAGVAKGLARGLVVVTLQNARRPGLIQRVHAITTKGGRFRVSFRPRFSGRIRVRFAGDATHRTAGADAGIARVHPRLVVSITGTRAANGSLENPHVHGRLIPAGGPVRVVWQARPAHGGAWLLFCRTADQLDVGRSGVIDGTCHVSGLNAGNRYRLVVLGDAGASYLPAATKGMVARPTS